MGNLLEIACTVHPHLAWMRGYELRGLTIDRVSELCGAKHIKVYGMTKDALIEQLYEVRGSTEDGERLSTTHPM